MRPLRLVLAAGCLLSGSACGSTGGPAAPAAPSAPETFTQGSIEASASLATRPLPASDDSPLLYGAPDPGLVVRYSVTNESTSPVVVNDRIPDGGVATGPSDPVDPIAAYVLAGDGGVAEITKRTFAQKDGAFDYSVSIQGTVLEPGKTLEGTAFVVTPLEAGPPGWAVLPASTRTFPEEPTRWRMCIGVRPGPRSQEQTFDGGRHVMSTGTSDQKLLCSSAEKLPRR